MNESAAVRKPYAALRVLAYLLILAGILSLWFLGLRWLWTHGFVGNIYAGMQTSTANLPVSVSAWRLWVALALLVALIVFRKHSVALVPPLLRTLILPLPFYLLFTFDWRWSLALAAIGGALWAFHRPLEPYLKRISPFLFPLAYVYLLTRSILQTVVIAVLFGAFLLFTAWMKVFFDPVWRFQARLPKRVAQVLLVLRLLIGISIPFVLSYSLGMVPTGYPHPFPWLKPVFTDNLWLLVAFTVLCALFVTRSPTVERPT